MGKGDELGAMNEAETYKRALTYKDGKELILPKTNCKGESVLSNDIFKVSSQSRDTRLCVNELSNSSTAQPWQKLPWG